MFRLSLMSDGLDKKKRWHICAMKGLGTEGGQYHFNFIFYYFSVKLQIFEFTVTLCKAKG